LGGTGLAARFGGDEFMILKPVAAGEAGREDALALARRAVLDLSIPFLLTDIPVRIGASAGILVSASAATAGGTTQLLEQVDRALYAAKRAGGSRCAWADENIRLERAAG
jgi:diguanylate cyclase (GGDEF)-like protein